MFAHALSLCFSQGRVTVESQPPRAVDESVEECLFIMHEFGFRHLPIVDGKELKGLVSLRDILMRQAAEIERMTRRAAS